MYAHQRCTPKLSDKDYGNRLINHYLENHFKTPKNFECYLYVSQILQAEGVKKGIEVYRQNMKDKYCMGTLYWQINDCWPAASWSSIDYYGNWKALHYYVKDSYKPIIITFESLCDSINIHLVSDSIERKKALLSLKLIDFSGNCLKEESLDVDIKSNTSYIIHSVKKSDLLKSSKGNRDILLYCSLVDSKNNIIAKNIFYLDRLKNLNLLKPTISTNIIKSNNNYIIKLISDKLAKNVYLEFENLQGYFSNNFFDLLPNNEIEILYKKTNTIENKNSSNVRLKIITLYDSYTN
ncbi:MAG: glycoside hydrolase family 2 protein [Clostridiales bacterium]